VKEKISKVHTGMHTGTCTHKLHYTSVINHRIIESQVGKDL